jgi:hypothetical protein
MSSATEGQALLRLLAEELERPLDARSTGADDEELQWIAARVRVLSAAQRSGSVPVGIYPAEIGRMVTDAWHPGTALAERLLQFEHDAFATLRAADGS